MKQQIVRWTQVALLGFAMVLPGSHADAKKCNKRCRASKKEQKGSRDGLQKIQKEESEQSLYRKKGAWLPFWLQDAQSPQRQRHQLSFLHPESQQSQSQ